MIARRPAGDTGSMPLAMLLTLVGITLSALLASVAMTHVRTTQQVTARIQAEHAALGGLDAVLGHLRAVGRTNGYGNIGTLPCPAGTAPAVAGDTADTGTYQAWVTYHTATNAAMPCPLAAVPAYARVRSQGAAPGGAVRRTLTARYTFQTTNENIPGGQIRVHEKHETDTDRCLDGGPDAAAGTVVTIEDCRPDSAGQLFAYTRDLTIKLKRAAPDSYPTGLCVDSGATPQVGAEVTLQECASPPVARQRWVFNTFINFEGVTGDSPNGFCWNASVPGQSGFPVILGKADTSPATCRRGPYDDRENFVPDAAVGAEAAGAASRQLVNFKRSRSARRGGTPPRR